MTMPQKCEGCGKRPPVVGWGARPEWLCLRCFDKTVGALMVNVRRLLGRP